MAGPGLIEARVRLEGRLKVLENAQVTLGEVTRAVKERRVDGLVKAVRELESPQYVEAKQAAERLTTTFPVLRGILTDLERAEARLREAVELRAASLHLGGGSTLDLATRLEEEPPLFEPQPRRLRRLLLFFAVPAALWAWCLSDVARRGFSLPLLTDSLLPATVILTLAMGAVFFDHRPVSVVLTRRRIIVGTKSALITADARVRFSFHEEGGHRHVLVLPSLPLPHQRFDLSGVWSLELERALYRCDHPPARDDEA